MSWRCAWCVAVCVDHDGGRLRARGAGQCGVSADPRRAVRWPCSALSVVQLVHSRYLSVAVATIGRARRRRHCDDRGQLKYGLDFHTHGTYGAR